MDPYSHNPSSDFLQTVACEYRPGIVRFGVDDFSLSVSIPVIKLADDIPARALMAWDRRLLSRTQHLTLLISGLRGTYPPLNAEGALTRDAAARGTALQFKVGLTRKYKPSKEHALEAKRTYGLVEEDPDEVGWTAAEEVVLTVDGGLPMDNLVPEEEAEEEDEDEGGLDSFSLSSSLEGLLDHSLVRVIQTRVKYGLGWAGAEILVAESERLQQTTDDVFSQNRKVCSYGLNLIPRFRSFHRSSMLPTRPNVNWRRVTTCHLIPLQVTRTQREISISH